MRQFCSVCKEYYDMEVVQEGGEDGTWVRCPGCRGILPYREVDDVRDGKGKEEAFGPDSFRKADVVEYDAHSVFEVGHVIYHRSWNDYGKVLEKIHLPGGRSAIKVQFLQQGDVQLLENVVDES